MDRDRPIPGLLKHGCHQFHFRERVIDDEDLLHCSPVLHHALASNESCSTALSGRAVFSAHCISNSRDVKRCIISCSRSVIACTVSNCSCMPASSTSDCRSNNSAFPSTDVRALLNP